MKIKNSQKLREEILDAIEADGVHLSEFTKEQQKRIIVRYAANVIGNK